MRATASVAAGCVRPTFGDLSTGSVPSFERPDDSQGGPFGPTSQRVRVDGQVLQAQGNPAATATTTTPTPAAGSNSGPRPPRHPRPLPPARSWRSSSPTLSDCDPPLSDERFQPANPPAIRCLLGQDRHPRPSRRDQDRLVPGTADKTTTPTMIKFDLTTATAPPVGSQKIILTTASTVTSANQILVNVIIPQSGQLLPPTITMFSNGKFIPPTGTLPTDPKSTPANVYGTYVRLLGRDGPVGGSTLDFYFYALENGLFVFKNALFDVDINLLSGTPAGVGRDTDSACRPAGARGSSHLRSYRCPTSSSAPSLSEYNDSRSRSTRAGPLRSKAFTCRV